MAGRGELTGWTPQLRNLAGCVRLPCEAAHRRRATCHRQAPEPVSGTGGTATEHATAGRSWYRRLPGRPLLAAVRPAPVVGTPVAGATVVGPTVVGPTAAGATVVGATVAGAAAVR
jgi:hypothetical protein